MLSQPQGTGAPARQPRAERRFGAAGGEFIESVAPGYEDDPG
jgi:hypothetical protein